MGPRAGQFLVEFAIEDQDLALHRAGPQSAKLLPIVNDYDLGGKAIGWCGHAAAQRGEHDLLRSSRRLTEPRDQLARLDSAHPVRNLGLFESDVGSQQAHLRRDVVDSLFGLGRAAQPWTDIVGEVAQFVEGIGVRKSSIAQALHGG